MYLSASQMHVLLYAFTFSQHLFIHNNRNLSFLWYYTLTSCCDIIPIPQTLQFLWGVTPAPSGNAIPERLCLAVVLGPVMPLPRRASRRTGREKLRNNSYLHQLSPTGHLSSAMHFLQTDPKSFRAEAARSPSRSMTRSLPLNTFCIGSCSPN